MRLVASVLALVMLASSAHADDDLPEAQRLEAALEYEQALAIVERVIESGKTTDPAHLAELHFFAGRLAGGLDRAEVARQHFARALELRPDLTLPPGTSPKLTGPFDLARLQVQPVEVHAVGGQDGSITLQVVQYPLPVVVAIGFQIGDGAVQPAGGLSSVPPPGARAVVALDKYGNRVWVGPIPNRPPSSPGFPVVHHSVFARTGTWAVISLAGVFGGALCAWRFQTAQDEWDQFSQQGTHDYSQLRAIETRGRRWGLGANVGFGIAAGAGITAAVFFVLHRHDPPILIAPDMVVFARDF